MGMERTDSQKYKLKLIFRQAFKIMIGSSLAIVIAMALDLQFATSAGIIALLTILTTKLETLQLSVYRIVTFVITVILAFIVFGIVNSIWLSYGIFIFIVVFCSEFVGWKSTISVNAVIGTHYLTTKDFSTEFMLNEFMLVMIGITIAILLNGLNRNSNSVKVLEEKMLYTEMKMKEILEELGQYLKNETMERNVWEDTKMLEKSIEHFIELSCAYNNNTFKKDGDYYEKYFEMRLMQLSVLHNLHYEMRKIRTMPVEAASVADYIFKLKDHILELNNPRKQIEQLEATLSDMLKGDLPTTIEEFEGKAILYHILMDIDEFLRYKMRFVESVQSTERFQDDYHNKKLIKKGE